MSNSTGLNQIKENDPNEIEIVCGTLLKILKNITDKPTDLSLRRISLESDEVLYNLMPYEGALAILFEIGFQEVIINISRIEKIVSL